MMHTISKFLVPVFVTFMLTACGTAGGNDVSLVKTAYLQLDKSVTVGNALDKYKYFKITEWKSFITEKGQHIVECNGIVDIDKFNKFYRHLVQRAGNTVAEDSLPVELSILIQFKINNDNTFNLSYIEQNNTDNKGRKTKSPILLENFQNIYNDCWIS